MFILTILEKMSMWIWILLGLGAVAAIRIYLPFVFEKIPLWVWPLLILLIAVGVQTWRLHSAQTKIAEEHVQTISYITAQQANLAAIGRLKASNEDYAKTCDLSLKNAKITVAETLKYAEQQQARAASAEVKLESIYAHNPDAKTWAAVAVRRAVRQQLRNSAPGSSHGNRRRPRSSAGAPRA